MNRLASTCLALLTCWISPPGMAGEIYKHLDKHGNPVFTDQPPAAESAPVELTPLNTLPAGPRLRQQAGPDDKPRTPYTRLTLTGIATGTTLQNPQEPLTLGASPDIPLQPGDRLFFIHNGQEASNGHSTVLVIEQIERGQHQFSAEIRDAKGKVLVESEVITIQVHRPSVPANRVAPR